MSRDQVPILPEILRFLWTGRRCAGDPSYDYPATFTSDVDLSSLTPTDPDVAVVDGKVGYTKIIHSFGPALFSPSGTVSPGDPTNRTHLDDLAKRFAQDWFDWATSDKPGDIVYSGIVAPKVCGLIDSIAFAYTLEDVSTRVQSVPPTGQPDRMAHMDTDVSGCANIGGVTSSYDPAVVVALPGVFGASFSVATIGIEGGRLVAKYLSNLPAQDECACQPPVQCTLCVCITSRNCTPNQLAGVQVFADKYEITAVLTSGGSSYTSPPGVTTPNISAACSYYDSIDAAYHTLGYGRCTSASVQAALSPTSLASVAVSSGGSGYTAGHVTVRVTGGGGSGAVVHANVSGGAIASFTVVDGGFGYTTLPSIGITDDLSPTNGSASGQPSLSPTSVGSLVVTDQGGGYRPSMLASYNALTFVGGGGSGAAGHLDGVLDTAIATAITTGMVVSLTLSNGGSGYRSPTISFSGGGGTGATATVSVKGGIIPSVTLVGGGSGYAANPTVTVGDANGGPFGWHARNAGVGALFSGGVDHVDVVTGGTGYGGSAPTVTFDFPPYGVGGYLPGAAAATGHAILDGTGDTVVSVVIDGPGQGYWRPVGVTFSAPTSGTTATGLMVLGTGPVGQVYLYDGGIGYSAPTATFSGGGGSGATVSFGTPSALVLDPDSIVITNGGSGYTSAPTPTLSDPAGTGGAFNTPGVVTQACLGLVGPFSYPLRAPSVCLGDIAYTPNIGACTGGATLPRITPETMGHLTFNLVGCRGTPAGSSKTADVTGPFGYHLHKTSGFYISSTVENHAPSPGTYSFTEVQDPSYPPSLYQCYNAISGTATIPSDCSPTTRNLTLTSLTVPINYSVTGCVGTPAGLSTDPSSGPADCNVTVTISAPRYATQVFTRTVPCDNSAVVVLLTPQSGYSCFCACTQPIPDTLHGTCPMGSVTMTRGTLSGYSGDDGSVLIQAICVLISGTISIVLSYTDLSTNTVVGSGSITAPTDCSSISWSAGGVTVTE